MDIGLAYRAGSEGLEGEIGWGLRQVPCYRYKHCTAIETRIVLLTLLQKVLGTVSKSQLHFRGRRARMRCYVYWRGLGMDWFQR